MDLDPYTYFMTVVNKILNEPDPPPPPPPPPPDSPPWPPFLHSGVHPDPPQVVAAGSLLEGEMMDVQADDEEPDIDSGPRRLRPVPREPVRPAAIVASRDVFDIPESDDEDEDDDRPAPPPAKRRPAGPPLLLPSATSLPTPLQHANDLAAALASSTIATLLRERSRRAELAHAELIDGLYGQDQAGLPCGACVECTQDMPAGGCRRYHVDFYTNDNLGGKCSSCRVSSSQCGGREGIVEAGP
ncbi:uncharacterized protein BDZ99DRAFT_518573 [Mytilinidion resinicola]|uniref:Uncharacterized protein n=1 Tax=Mytilinidion resinicola TaxID=574789 RepID=A0A6A6YVH2_9PEZI|nr:uncharacterized protein BDZ99DRAFT_518573 [Mytilinidion resinicola]KAF2812760.1 hypothetical protein BDZ99DRAFT_518573 [Mytilinidion resinicola]